LAGLAAILFIGLIAVTNNQQEVTITYFFGGDSWTGRLWIALLASFSAGAVAASLFCSFFIIREKLRGGALSRKVSKLEEEVKALKQRPMPDEQLVFPVDPAAIAPRATHSAQ